MMTWYRLTHPVRVVGELETVTVTVIVGNTLERHRQQSVSTDQCIFGEGDYCNSHPFSVVQILYDGLHRPDDVLDEIITVDVGRTVD